MADESVAMLQQAVRYRLSCAPAGPDVCSRVLVSAEEAWPAWAAAYAMCAGLRHACLLPRYLCLLHAYMQGAQLASPCNSSE